MWIGIDIDFFRLLTILDVFSGVSIPTVSAILNLSAPASSTF